VRGLEENVQSKTELSQPGEEAVGGGKKEFRDKKKKRCRKEKNPALDQKETGPMEQGGPICIGNEGP